jgi:hypothetical protein
MTTYNIGKMKKLIDLNSDLVNFEIKFTIKTKNKEPFYMCIIDQSTLDSTPQLDYKKIEEGEISGTIKNDKNVHQIFVLILKADQDCECQINLDKKELPLVNETISEPKTKVSKKTINWMYYIVLAIIVIAGCAFLYYYYFNKKDDLFSRTKNKSRNISQELSESPSIEASISKSPNKSPLFDIKSPPIRNNYNHILQNFNT